jgi:hypothetical protein
MDLTKFSKVEFPILDQVLDNGGRSSGKDSTLSPESDSEIEKIAAVKD